MNVLLGFAPFAVFAVLGHVLSLMPALFAAAAVSAVIIVHDLLRKTTPKLLEIGSMVLFGGLGLYALLFEPRWLVLEVRLFVDIGLLIIVAASIVVGRPFTLAYARERTPQRVWNQPALLKTSRAISMAWLAAIAMLVIADVVMVYVTVVPLKVGVVMSVLAILWAVRFTRRKIATARAISSDSMANG
ncbi:hypothetical protein [Variovorax sp.]|uniref:hypothetical protein n=1 Tax=Variovorax sp. TaxID=1871043 RepID=UPI002D7583F2|nr:hypothetical protein [Variovorax sp.]HYP84156.1 hypothetical protein [Variovorax sp.]